MDRAELLDAALEDVSPVTADPDVAQLLDLATEVARSLERGWLTAEERDLLYARVLELAVRRSPWAVARRLLAEHRVSAIAGGAAVTLAAGAAITVALARQHRQPAPAAA
ncbi:MAG TPA: hypothetical protein VF155_11595 [Candidatus Dormibacteraeota bacterium]